MVAVHHFGFWPSTPWNKGADLSTRPSTTPQVTLGSPPVSRAAAGRHVCRSIGASAWASPRGEKKRPQGGGCAEAVLSSEAPGGGARRIPTIPRPEHLFWVSQTLTVAKARGLFKSGWMVHVTDSSGRQYAHSEFDEILNFDRR
jgi:hypothetical protein